MGGRGSYAARRKRERRQGVITREEEKEKIRRIREELKRKTREEGREEGREKTEPKKPITPPPPKKKKIIGESKSVLLWYDKNQRKWVVGIKDGSGNILEIEDEEGNRTNSKSLFATKEEALNHAKGLSKDHRLSIEITAGGKEGRIKKTIAAPRIGRVISVMGVNKLDLKGASILGGKLRDELPSSSAWNHPSGLSIASSAISSYMRSPRSQGLVVARDENTGKFRGVSTYTPERTSVYVNFLSGTGGGTGTELLQSIIRENPGKALELTPLDTARSYYREIGMHPISNYQMGFTAKEAALFEKYGKKWKTKATPEELRS